MSIKVVRLSFSYAIDMFKFNFNVTSDELEYRPSDISPDHDIYVYRNTDGSELHFGESTGFNSQEDEGLDIDFVSMYDTDGIRTGIIIFDNFGATPVYTTIDEAVAIFSGSFAQFIDNIDGYPVSIEGSGQNDILYSVGSQCTLWPERGNDKMFSGEGPTVFAFRRQVGKDKIYDFDPEKDTISLREYLKFANPNEHNWWRKLNKKWVETKHGNTIIDLDGGKIKIFDVKFKALDTDNFDLL